VLTLADQTTLARLVLAPVAVAGYLLLPIEGEVCFWVAGWTCAAAELSDWLDGRIARARGEVSDFGKLADPFCDVFYRLAMFLVLLLPAGGVGLATDAASALLFEPLVFVTGPDSRGAGLIPFLPVLIMMLRELLAGALRSMSASKGLVLAARWSGKVKAWVQGTAIISVLAIPAFFGGAPDWLPRYASAITWLAALLSVVSYLEYLWHNRVVLGQLAKRQN